MVEIWLEIISYLQYKGDVPVNETRIKLSVAQNNPDGELVPPRTGMPLTTLDEAMLTWLAVAPFQSVIVCWLYNVNVVFVSTWLFAIKPSDPYTKV